jgi:hypothetical protein
VTATRCPALPPWRVGTLWPSRPPYPYPLPIMQTTATLAPGRCAPLAVPPDVADLLTTFRVPVPDLLTDSNPKMGKGATLARGRILHHLPAAALAGAVTLGHRGTIAPRGALADLRALAIATGMIDRALAHNGCPWATAGCAAGCLNWAGHGGLSVAVAAARGRRTLAMLADPVAYGRAVLWAIAREWQRAQADGLPLAVRLRGTDEGPRVGWHRLRLSVSPRETVTLARRYGLPVVAGDQLTLADALAVPRGEGTLHLYDYSKAPLSGPLGLRAQSAAGWDITASMAADRATAVADAAAAARAGYRLAVPVALAKGAPLPVALTLTPTGGAPVTLPAVDGDATDHRWAEPGRVAVILRTKISRGADATLADPFSLRATDHPQRLADGSVALTW